MPHIAPLLPWPDLSRLDGRATDHLDFLADLREAAHEVGFFYLTGLATNGYLRATVHRVVAPPPGAERLAVAFFLGAATVPLLTLPAALAADGRGPTSDPDNPLFQHVGTNYLKGRLRSHPDVAKRHYSDLIDTQTSCDYGGLTARSDR